jgi:hypothetical protein
MLAVLIAPAVAVVVSIGMSALLATGVIRKATNPLDRRLPLLLMDASLGNIPASQDMRKIVQDLVMGRSCKAFRNGIHAAALQDRVLSHAHLLS